ncbi:MAG: oligoribonuclease, partial [Burkholderiales bacterium]|nr:oligoribonuclease [Burkholderiales bacterium]
MSQESKQEVSQTTTVAAKPAKPNEMNLIWVDMEMTGLDPDSDKIIEVAVVVTDM